MTRRFLGCIFLLAVLLATQISLRADTTNGALAKSAIFEKNVLYLRVGTVSKNLAEEIQSAQSVLTATNKIVGTVLDLRFAGGDDLDSAKSAEHLIAAQNLPLAILVNDQTRDAAATLAVDLRAARAGLIFGGASAAVKPDISISVNTTNEEKFLENPFGTISTNQTNFATSTTNDFLPSVDHTTEADLVREKIRDGDEDDEPVPARPVEAPKKFIRDPVLARGLDFVKGLAIFHLSHS